MLQKNGWVKSDDLKTGLIPNQGQDVKTIGGCIGCPLEQESALDVDTNVHVLLSNIELRQNE